MNDKRYSDLQTGLKNAIDEKEKERLKEDLRLELCLEVFGLILFLVNMRMQD